MKPNNEAHALTENPEMGGLSETGPTHAKEMKRLTMGLWIQMRKLCVWDLLTILLRPR